jgi:general secretion pathway protein E
MRGGMTEKKYISEAELPRGRVISFEGDELEIKNDVARRNILIWDVTYNAGSQAGRKKCWLLSTPHGKSLIHYHQTKKDLNDNGYSIEREGFIEDKQISSFLDRRKSEENQKANKEDSEVVAYFEMILSDAVKENISDIHISSRNNGGFIKMRKHGEMLDYQKGMALSEIDVFNLCSVIYNVLAENKDVAFMPDEYQQGAINYNVGDNEIKLRYQSLPVYPGGFDVVLRVLPIGKDEEFTPLQNLGYTDQQVAELLNISSRPVGSLIIAGVTGSGKSTTLKNLLMFINAHTEYKLKIYTIEDPPEYKIPRVSQIPVIRRKDDNESSGVSPFEAPIKACMRADPDIIMVGEVRDKVTGDLIKKAIQSGHQVLTTIHAASSIGIIDRLLDFGLTPSVLGSPDFLTGLLYQKLLPVLCRHCKVKFSDLIEKSDDDSIDTEAYNMYQRLHDVLGEFDPHNIYVRGTGCKHCNNLKVEGRTVCAEIIMLDLNMLKFILESDILGLMKYWRNLSDNKLNSTIMTGKTAMEHAMQKMLVGDVSPFDLEASFKPINELYADKQTLNQDDSIKATNHKSNHNYDSHNEKEDFINQVSENGWSEL